MYVYVCERRWEEAPARVLSKEGRPADQPPSWHPLCWPWRAIPPIPLLAPPHTHTHGRHAPLASLLPCLPGCSTFANTTQGLTNIRTEANFAIFNESNIHTRTPHIHTHHTAILCILTILTKVLFLRYSLRTMHFFTGAAICGHYFYLYRFFFIPSEILKICS